MKLFFKTISLALFTAVLFGCGSEGNSTPDTITPPVVTPEPTLPPISEAQLSAIDFHTSVQFSQLNQPLTFSLSNFIAYSKADNITLKNIEVLTDSPICQITELNTEQQSFTITPNKAGSCDYRYTISTEGEEKSAWASITFSAAQGVQVARNDYQVIPKDNLLPDISKATSVGETITFSIYDELSSELLAMTNPVFNTSTVVAGSGLAFITKNGDFSYHAVDIGVTKVSYSVVDENGLAFTGLINIDVSGDINTAPITNDATYGRTQAVGDELTLDIMKFPGFGPLVSDAEGDKIQLVSLQVLNAEVKLVDANDVTNTSFTFRGDSKAVYTVDYTVYDHEVDGISTGTISIETGYIREGILEFSFNGFIKLFGDGALGAAGRNTLMRPFREVLMPYMENNGLYATAIKNIGFGNYKIDVNSDSGAEKKILLFTADNALQLDIENLIEVPGTSRIYYGLTYADRIQGYAGIAYEVTADNRLIAHNQIYGTSNTSYGLFVDQLNALNLTGVNKVGSFGPLSAVVYFNSGEQIYYSINASGANELYVYPFENKFDLMTQCWDAPNNGLQNGSFYCIKKDQSKNAFRHHESDDDPDPRGNIYLEFARYFNNNDDVKLVKSTQVPKGMAALSADGDLYVLFDGKDKDGNTYQLKKVASKVNSYQQAANYVTYMRGNRGDLEFGGYAQYHQETTPEGKKLDLTIKFSDMDDDDSEDVTFYENTANAIALLIKGELYSLTVKGLHKLDKKDHSNNIIGDSANSYGIRTNTAGQGKSTFFARGDGDHSTHWDLLSPLKGVDKSYECPKIEHDQVHYPYILTGCTYIDFKMNGAVVPSEDSGITVYPEVRFANEDAAGLVYPDLVDLDHDGLSTKQEMAECLTKPTSWQASKIEYCSQPNLSDSDADDVLDSFEFLHQDTGKGNYHSRFSHIVGDYKKNEFGPYDGNKDIDNNGQDDKYDN